MQASGVLASVVKRPLQSSPLSAPSQLIEDGEINPTHTGRDDERNGKNLVPTNSLSLLFSTAAT